jgi:Fanconi anemia group M protein
MSIFLDTREHGLQPLLPEAISKQLSVGDAWIMHEEQPIVIIERKTTADFEASFLDGRYREQRTRLLAHSSERKAKALYILEGGLEGKTRKLQRRALQKLANRLMLRYGVPVWCSLSLEDTASMLQILAEQVKEDPKVFEGETISYTDVQHITKKANKEDPKAFACAALQQCPGLSAKSVLALLETFGTFQGVMNAEEKDLATVKHGERRLGPVVAKRLYGLLHAISI